MTGYASVSGQGGKATGAPAASRRRGQDGASDRAGTEQDMDRVRLNDGVDWQTTCAMVKVVRGPGTRRRGRGAVRLQSAREVAVQVTARSHVIGGMG